MPKYDKNQADFSGWATRFNVLCADKRTIKPGCFKHQDGEVVPLVWSHSHDDNKHVLGHALLEDRAEGVYMYGFLNNTERAQDAKEQIRHGAFHQRIP